MDENQLTVRQPLFVAANLKSNQVFCIDDRSSDYELSIKVPGGLEFLVNDSVLMHLSKEHKLGLNIEDETKTMSQLLNSKGLKCGIHSDEKADPGGNVLNNESASLGCGYICYRREIVASIGENGKEIVDKLESLMPELFTSSSSKDMALRLAKVYGELAADDEYFNASPRQIAKAAITNGAPCMIVKGQHNPNAVAIINLVPSTTFDTNEALKKGLPAYDYDDWAFNDVLDMLPDQFGWDKEVQQMSSLIDFIGTVKYLGVKDIFVRR